MSTRHTAGVLRCAPLGIGGRDGRATFDGSVPDDRGGAIPDRRPGGPPGGLRPAGRGNVGNLFPLGEDTDGGDRIGFGTVDAEAARRFGGALDCRVEAAAAAAAAAAAPYVGVLDARLPMPGAPRGGAVGGARLPAPVEELRPTGGRGSVREPIPLERAGAPGRPGGVIGLALCASVDGREEGAEVPGRDTGAEVRGRDGGAVVPGRKGGAAGPERDGSE